MNPAVTSKPALPAFLRAAALLAALVAACSSNGTTEPKPCDDRSDCAEAEICRADGTCGPGECQDDAACIAKDARTTCDVAAQTCVLRDGFADECDAARPCAFGKFCSELLGRCLDAASSRDCTRRGQCPAGQTCDRSANKCIPDVGCYGDEFCEPGELCDFTNKTCQQLSQQCTRCSGDGTCGAGATCDAARNECVPTGGQAACGTGEFCDPLLRCVQCITDAQCGAGTFCNVSVGRCESNVQCADDPSECPSGANVQCVTCVLPQLCDARTKQCQAPPTPCEDDTTCGSGERCDRTQDPPICVRRVADCLPDLLEPNDRAMVARLLAPTPGSTSSTYEELKLCPGDQDWYRLDVAGGTYLSLDARFRQRDGDIDVEVFAADGRTLLADSRSTSDVEHVELALGTDVTLYVRVFLAVPAVEPVPYTFVVTRDAAPVCADDRNEPDDVRAQARPLVSDRPYEGVVCAADEDWFVIEDVPASTELTVTLAFRNSLGDLDLELYRDGGATPLVRAAANDVDLERVTLPTSFRGRFFVRVVGKRADANVYTLRADLRPVTGLACLDDAAEPNDDAPRATRTATAIGRVVLEGRTLCTADEDWYVVPLQIFEGLVVELGTDSTVDFDLELFGPEAALGSVSPLRTSRGVQLRELVTWRAIQTGDHYIRVKRGRPEDLGLYELRIDHRVAAGALCEADVIDQSGQGATQQTPFFLPFPPFRLDDLSLCIGDQDWYEAFLISGFVNVVRLQYQGEDAQLDLEIYDTAGNLLGASGGMGSAKEFAVNLAGNGVAPVVLHVVPTSGFETTYSLVHDLVVGYSCVEDAFELNDAVGTATALTIGTSTLAVETQRLANLSLCVTRVNGPDMRGDEDWFVIRPPRAGARMSATIAFDQGDLFLELRSPGGVARACANTGADRRCYSDGNGLTETITFTATTTEPYFVRVGSIYGSPTVPLRPLSLDTPYTLDLELRR